MKEKIEVLTDAYNYIEKLYYGIQDDIEILRSMNTTNHSELTIQIIDGLRWLIDAIRLTIDMQVEPINILEIKGILGEMLEAFENEDNTLLADMFEYEVLGVLDRWHDILWKTVGGQQNEFI